MPQLASTDWLVVLLYLLGMVGLGIGLRSSINNSKDFFQAGRSLPTWVCTVAFIGASLGAQEVIGLGAAGAAFGFRAALYFLLGTIPALLFVALFIVPVYYKSGAVTLPGYLGKRFGTKTQVLSAALFVAMALASAGIALFLMARILEALRIFNSLFFAYGWPRQGIFLVCILLAAVPVFIYVTVAGLRGTMISQVTQFFLLVAGFLPVVWIGLTNIGGWSGFHASLAAIPTPALAEFGSGGIAAIALLLGLVFGAARWTTDFRVIQFAMAAKDATTARRIPLMAAAVRLAIPFLLILPGAIAISLPTPQTKTVVRNENGEIYHEITIVPRTIAEGKGLVPALIDPATNNARLDDTGHARLDYAMGTPNLITRFATTGLLGLAIAALLASLMSGVATGVMAVSTVFACDLYQPLRRESPGDATLLRAARWAAAVAVLLSVGTAFAVAVFSGKGPEMVLSAWLVALLMVFSILQAPQLATFVLGAFTRRTTGRGAFAGLAAGIVVALLHYGLTLPAGAQAGLQGGWLAVLHRYPGLMAQAGLTVALGVAANLAVAGALSLGTDARPAAELKSLVYAKAPSKPAKASKSDKPPGKRPEILALIVMLITLVLAVVFA